MPAVRANDIEIAYESLGREGDPRHPADSWSQHALDRLAGFALRRAFGQGLPGRPFRQSRHRPLDPSERARRPDIREILAKRMRGERVEAPYALDDMADDAVGLLGALGIEKAHVVGASMGGMIAQLVAIRRPEKTRSLISIMSSTARRGLPPPDPEAMKTLMNVPASASREDRLKTAMTAVRAISGAGFAPSDLELAAHLGRSIDYTPFDPPAAARQMAAIITAEPRNARLAALEIPALVLHGKDDPVVPVEHGEDTARSIPGAKLTIVPGMGHRIQRGADADLHPGDRRFRRMGGGGEGLRTKRARAAPQKSLAMPFTSQSP